MNDIQKFQYEYHSISFEFGDGNKLINATEMAKPFGKPVGNFLRLAETKTYITLLEARYSDVNIGGQPKETLRVVKGGEPHLQGTWMDEKLALKFAAWLSPEFELWVYDRIQELLMTGSTQVRSFNPSGVIKGLRMVLEQLEHQEQFNAVIREDVNLISDRIDEIEAKITSVDDHYYTIAGYCSLQKIPCPLDRAKVWGKAAAAASRKQGVAMGVVHDERYGRVRTYHEDILRETIGNS